MSLLEQMEWLDRLRRDPGLMTADLILPSDVGGLLATVDPDRLAAVHSTFASLVLSRWWQPRFGATLAALGTPLQLAGRLVGTPAFERAEGEDVTAAVFVSGVLDLAETEWIAELLRYEYLLTTGLPRRARGEAVCGETEERLLGDATWLEGGRLARKVLVCPFTWPVAELLECAQDPEPDPHTRLFFCHDGEVVEADPPDVAIDVLELLASGATDEVIAALGDEGAEALDWLGELDLVS